MTARALPEIVGAFVRNHRRKHKITKDQLALAGARYGMSWGRTSIDNIEAGKSALTIPTLYALCAALSGWGRGSVTFDAMVGDNDEVTLAGEFVVRGDALKEFLAGEPVPRAVGDSIDVFLDSLTRHAATYTLAERRAASSLGIDTGELVRLSIELWGDRLERVVAQTVGPEANAQTRGHETRRRIEDLRRHRERRGDG